MLNVLFRVLTPSETVMWIQEGSISGICFCRSLRSRVAVALLGIDTGGSHCRGCYMLLGVAVGTRDYLPHLYIPDSHCQLKRNKNNWKYSLSTLKLTIPHFSWSAGMRSNTCLHINIPLWHKSVITCIFFHTSIENIVLILSQEEFLQLWNHKGSLKAEVNTTTSWGFSEVWVSEADFYFGHHVACRAGFPDQGSRTLTSALGA